MRSVGDETQAPLSLPQVREYLDALLQREGERRRRARDAAMRAQATCAICLSDFARGEPLVQLPGCRHRFHAHCVDQLAAHAAAARKPEKCPCCQQPVTLAAATACTADLPASPRP